MLSSVSRCLEPVMKHEARVFDILRQSNVRRILPPQLPTTAERAVIKSNRRVQFRQHSRKLGGAAEHLIDGSEKRICRLSFEF